MSHTDGQFASRPGRFMFNVYIDYPREGAEEKILSETTRGRRPPLSQVIDGHALDDVEEPTIPRNEKRQ